MTYIFTDVPLIENRIR